MVKMSNTTVETFYSESHDELNRHLKVKYDHQSGDYIISGLGGEDPVNISEEDLEGESSVAAYQNALEENKEDSEEEVWKHEEIDSLI